MKLYSLGPVEMFPFTKKVDEMKIPYFRTPEFSAMMLDSERLMKKCLDTAESSKVVFLTASGTGAMEATVINCFDERDRLLVIDGGIFGHRFVTICEAYRIPHDVVTLPYGETLTAEALAPFEHTAYTGLLVNIDETSTCQLYDIGLLSDFCQRKGMYLIVDAISSFLADEYHMDRYHIDATILSSQKGLALAPGMSFVTLSERLYEQRVSRMRAPSLYFDFNDYIENQKRGQPPFTSAVRVAFELNDMLHHLDEEGVSHRVATVAACVRDFRERLRAVDVTLPGFPLSNAATPLVFPKRNAFAVYTILKEKYDTVLTPCGGDLRDLTVRVGHLGYHTMEENPVLIDLLQRALAEAGEA